MKGHYKSDKDIINALKKGGKETNKALAHLFENKIIFNRVQNYVLYNGGGVQDATDVYIESLIILEKNIRKNKFKQDSTLMTYLTGIAKYCWSQMKKSKGIPIAGNESMALELEIIDTPEHLFITNELKAKLNQALELLGEKCKTLLKMWSQNYSSEEISKHLEMPTPGAVRKQKFYCKERLAEIIKSDLKVFGVYLNE